MTVDVGTPVVFVLDQGREPEFVPVLDIGARWMEFPFTATRSRGFVMLAGERMEFPEFVIDRDHRLYLELMRVIEEASTDGLELRVSLQAGTARHLLAELHLGNEQAHGESLRCQVELAPYSGLRARLLLECLPGRDSDATADWCALLACAVAGSEQMARALATSQFEWRVANETAMFSHVYEHEMYREPPRSTRDAARTSEVTTLAPSGRRHRVEAEQVLARLRDLPPNPGETVFAYATRLLSHLIPRGAIDFAGRLRAVAARQRRPRMLSLCAGEARIERQLLEQAGVDVHLTLLDLNGTLLERAASRMPAEVDVRLWEASVDALDGVDETFDVVCFVSGLHHVPALEAVLSQVARLVPTGDLWIIGEQVGRNGNRLWPEAQRVADRLFGELPERLRNNRSTGRVDAHLPDVNYATSCFEGIRSEEIHRCLAREFMPVCEELRNCFLWRLIEPAYASNYDTGNDDDARILQRLVAEEFAFYANGGLGCELNGIYRNKLSPGW